MGIIHPVLGPLHAGAGCGDRSRGRPELLDIGRVINQAQPGAMTVRWGATFTPPVAEVVLVIAITTPVVACSLKLGFHLPRESEILESIIQAPAFAITPHPLQGLSGPVEPLSAIAVSAVG